MSENDISTAQNHLNFSPVAAVITDKNFVPIWYNDSYQSRFEPFKNIEELLSSILFVDANDKDLFMFKKVFIPITVKHNKTGETFYLTKYPIFRGDKFIISLTAKNQWIDKYSYSDEFFRQAFLMTPKPIVLFSFGTGEIKYLNSAFSRICGMPAEHITNMSLINLFPEGRGILSEYLSRPEPYTKPFIINAVQTDNKSVALEVSPFVFNENGNVMVVFNVQDITKHMASQLEVINDDSEEYAVLSGAIENAVIVTEEKRIINVNEKACLLWGYDRNELIGNHVSILFQDGKIAYKATDNNAPIEFMGIRKGGAVFKGEKISKYLFTGSGHIMINVLWPHGNRGFQYESFSFAGEKGWGLAKKMLDYQPNLIIVYGKSNKVISCNKAMLDFFRCDEVEDFKKKYTDIYKLFIPCKGECLGPESGEGWFLVPLENPNKEYKVSLKEPFGAGAEKIFFVKSGKINDEEALYIVSFSDITETVQTTLAFKDANSLLIEKAENAEQELHVKEDLLIQQQKLASMGEMLGIITHQWKQPLNAIGILAQHIESIFEECGDIATKSEVGELTASIMEHISFMSETADNFKDFLNVNNRPAKFSIDKVVLQTIKILNGIFGKNDITIDYNFSEEKSGLTVYGYSNDLKQVIMNIATNAKDSIASKRAASGRHMPGKMSINLKLLDENKAELSVSDNGAGIPEKVLPRVFDRYFTTKAESGTGIGMYISKVIIDKIGGTIACENWEEGARIIMTLPVSTEG